MTGETTILVVEDDEALRESILAGLQAEGYGVIEARSPTEAGPILHRDFVDLVVTDLRMGDGGGMEVIRVAQEAAPGVPVIVITAFPSVDTAVQTLKRGAVDYLVKPFTADQLYAAVEAALTSGRALDGSSLLRGVGRSADGLPEIVGRSGAVHRLIAELREIAAQTSPVLLSGEPGTGKELAARALHRLSQRADGPFVALSCPAIPEGLFESELFGHERGAFTGAVKARRGLLHQADGGTLVLMDVTALPAVAQARLLVTLESGSVRPLGADRGHPVDVRIVATTSVDLAAAVQGDTFSEGLYYRLATVEVHLPPLRERREDIGALAVHFLDQAHAEGECTRVVGFDDEALRLLEGHDWPGNVSELETMVRRLAARTRTTTITALDVVGLSADAAPEAPVGPSTRLSNAVEGFEREHVARVLSSCDGNVSRAARALDVHRTTLQRLMVKYGLRRAEGRD